MRFMVLALLSSGCLPLLEELKTTDLVGEWHYLAEAPAGEGLTMKLDELRSAPVPGQPGDPDPAGERIRRASLSVLTHDGFRVAPTLPILSRRDGPGPKPRPREEIATRLLCHFVVLNHATDLGS